MLGKIEGRRGRQRYERGERELPLWAAIKLADYYNVTLDYLVGRKNK